MREEFGDVKAIGFDLDGTLYKSSATIDNRVREKISEKILERMPSLQNVENARYFFEESYKDLQSGTTILKKIGYENAREIMDACLATADILDLIPENKKLEKFFERLNEKYYEVYLLTKSPKELSLQKLKKIGVGENLFTAKYYSDTPNIGSKIKGEAFDFVLKNSIYSPHEHVYIGDRKKSDILPAKEKGMKTISVHSTIDEADFSIANINDLEEILL